MSDTQDIKPTGCPVAHDSVTAHGSESENPAIDSPTPKTGGRPRTNRDWWPNQLDLSVLHAHSSKSDPLGPDFSYAAAFAKQEAKIVSAITGASDNVVSRRATRTRAGVAGRDGSDGSAAPEEATR